MVASVRPRRRRLRRRATQEADRDQARHARAARLRLGQRLPRVGEGREGRVRRHRRAHLVLQRAAGRRERDDRQVAVEADRRAAPSPRRDSRQIYPSVIALQMPGLFDTGRSSTTSATSQTRAEVRQGHRGRRASRSSAGVTSASATSCSAPTTARAIRSSRTSACRRTSRRTTRSTSRATPIGSEVPREGRRRRAEGAQRPGDPPGVSTARRARSTSSPRRRSRPSSSSGRRSSRTSSTCRVGIGIGALVMYKEIFNSLPPDAKAVLEKTGKNTGELLTERIRGIDNDAWARALEGQEGHHAHAPTRRPSGQEQVQGGPRKLLEGRRQGQRATSADCRREGRRRS